MLTKKILFMFSKTILIADDTPLFVKLAKDLFRREQVDILVAENGPEAVEMVKNKRPAIIRLPT